MFKTQPTQPTIPQLFKVMQEKNDAAAAKIEARAVIYDPQSSDNDVKFAIQDLTGSAPPMYQVEAFRSSGKTVEAFFENTSNMTKPFCW